MISFLICGAQKSGTSALHQYLLEHPEINLSKTKELHIFDDEKRDWSEKGIRNIDKDIKHYFDDGDEAKKRGEATPSSMWWRPSMQRIWQYNDKMKLIAILRNPITRAYANWEMENSKGRDIEKIHTTLEAEEERCREALPQQHRVYSYLSRGLYSEQIRRIWQYFPRKNLLLIRQEELRQRPERTLRVVYDHLEVNETKFNEIKNVESWKSVRTLKKDRTKVKQKLEAVKAIENVYRNEIKNIEEITGWDCSSWLEE